MSQSIREERMRLDDVEWETGKRPDEQYLNYLIAERNRGICTHKTSLELVRNPDYDAWVKKHSKPTEKGDFKNGKE